ncbi:MAG: hypothetical protein HZR80_18930 [Candidatus Heimdallarchaeota archaeon]
MILEDRLGKMDELMTKIDCKFKNRVLLMKALLTKECSDVDFKWNGINQDSLEKVGNALIGFLAMERGYQEDLKTKHEMKKFKKKYTDNENLVKIAKKINLADYVIWSKNQLTTSQWLISDELYVDCLEAIIGAVYFDKGLKKAREVFWNLFETYTK